MDITPTVSTNSTVGQGDKAKETTPAPQQAAEDPTPLSAAASVATMGSGGEASASTSSIGETPVLISEYVSYWHVPSRHKILPLML